ncbi:hypothetical protein APS56_16145 [Pseudalgibacter alginicilyticus]|uniref:VOC domain-containing protein n=1 Tax=Pseudalgibacter alginicilyticus TaxID=1736674 RepID=A0A0P0CQ64_9FLAO|nr:VOC family protein [Pseudalgibacter alginicilyticus]ALJ06571.1 hypothetical protein APS56_16145 [Pseudalgibacter alginicilyticus]
MKANKPIVWFEIYVDDMERASNFYEAVLNITLETMPSPTDDAVQMKCFPGDMENYGATGALVKMEGFKAGGNSTLVYFGSVDCTIEEARVEQAGGKIVTPKMSIGKHGYISLFSDTEGNVVGLHSME